MFKEKLVLTYHALTPVHFGAGVSLSYVDNPIQREKHTDYPMLAGSGIKGVIRELASRKWNKDKVNTIFGPEAGEQASAYASCISFTDAKILLFPVRSVRGVFAWITSPYVLKRFKSELESLRFRIEVEIPSDVDDSKVVICNSPALKIDDSRVAFEEFVFEVDGSNNADAIATELEKYLPSELQNNFKSRFAIVSDNVFRDFVKYAVEIRTRIRINQTTGTVEEGGLFTVELVPAEAVFYGFVFITDPYNRLQNLNDFSAVKNEICSLLKDYSIIQFGGDETLGMGLMRVNVYDCQLQHPSIGANSVRGK